MYIEKLIRLRSINYYIRVEVEYQKNEKNNGIPNLKIVNYKNDYYDGGDFSTLLKEIEKNIHLKKSKFMMKTYLIWQMLYICMIEYHF